MSSEQSTSQEVVDESTMPSTEQSLEDLNVLNFPPDVDWSTTLVLRCDPSLAPFKLADLYRDLFRVLIRNDVHTLGPTVLNYVFTVSFKTNRATENFVRYLKNRKNGEILVKGQPILVTRVPCKNVTVTVRWIPVEVDSVHVLDVLKQYGSVVTSESVQSNMRGWFHVYTNERKFNLHLHKDVDPGKIPFGIYVKGLLGGVHVSERKPPSLPCYHDGHTGNICKYEGCPLFVAS